MTSHQKMLEADNFLRQRVIVVFLSWLDRGKKHDKQTNLPDNVLDGLKTYITSDAVKIKLTSHCQCDFIMNFLENSYLKYKYLMPTPLK